MIRKLNEDNRLKLMDFLLPEKEFNIFLIGDVENHGFSSEFQEIWGEFGSSGELKAVLLRYFQNSILYGPGDFDGPAFSRLIWEHGEIKTLMGKAEVIARLQADGNIGFSKIRTTYLARLIHLAPAIPLSTMGDEIRIASLSEIDEIVNFHSDIEEFNYDTPEEKRESLSKDLESGSGRCYYLNRGGLVVSTALTTAENSFSALIRGVATSRAHRNQGLATLCMLKLCRDLLQEGKTLCLFYDNPAAGAIYRRLGFRELGEWHFCFLDLDRPFSFG